MWKAKFDDEKTFYMQFFYKQRNSFNDVKTSSASNQTGENHGLFWCRMIQCNYWSINYVMFEWFIMGLFSKCTENVNIYM